MNPPYLASNEAVLPTTVNTNILHGAPAVPVCPVAVGSNWSVAHASPSTASNGGSSVQRMDTTTGSALRAIPCAGATIGQFCGRYDPSSAKTTTGPPTIELVGVDANGVPERLLDVDGNSSWSLAVGSADVASAANNYFTPSIEVDLKNSAWVYVFIKTAATGTAWTDADAAIMCKLK